jgi:hypothetical protein
MKLSVTILLAILAVANAQTIDSILYQKVQKSLPIVDEARFTALTANKSQNGSFFSDRVRRNWIHTRIAKSYDITLPTKKYTAKPYADFMALKWGTKLEYLESNKFVSGAGGTSWAVVTASIGVRVNEDIEMRTVIGWSHAVTNQMYNHVTYRSCKRRFFVKKCHNETRRVPRGLTSAELTVIQYGLVRNAHRGALEKMPKQLFANSEEEMDSELERHFNLANGPVETMKLFEVKANELASAVSSLVRDTATPSLTANCQGFEKSPRNGVIHHITSFGKFTVNINWDGKSFTVSSTI